MSNDYNPSVAGVRSTGLELRKRPQSVQSTVVKEETKVTTKQPGSPTPSNRGYA